MTERKLRGLVPREGWAPGPWDEEPDRVDWIDEDTGYPCLVTRHYFTGNLCGYVAVPPGHPLHGVAWGEDATAGLYAHRGVNYSAPCMEVGEMPAGAWEGSRELLVCHVPEPGQPDDVWWFGFDCGHAFDSQPGRDARMRDLDMRLGQIEEELPEDHPLRRRYAPLPYVRAECRSLAAQLAAAAQ